MRNSRAQEMTMEVTVGAFMFMVLLALGVFTIILSSGSLFRETHTLTVVFEEVMGLRAGESVLVRGVNVGQVNQIRLTEEGVELDLALTRDLPLRTDYAISITPSSVLGGKQVSIHQGSPGADPLPPDSRIIGETPIDFVDQASKTIAQIREALEEGEILENLERVMADFRSLSEDLSAGRGTLGKLLKEETIYNDLSEITANLKGFSAEVAEGEGTLARLIRDDSLYEDLQAISGNLRSMSQRLADGQGTLGKLLSEDDTLYTNLLEASESIRALTADIQAGKGTLGKLAQEDDVYEDIQLVLNDLRGAIDDFRETAPITTFTSIFFGAF